MEGRLPRQTLKNDERSLKSLLQECRVLLCIKDNITNYCLVLVFKIRLSGLSDPASLLISVLIPMGVICCTSIGVVVTEGGNEE